MAIAKPKTFALIFLMCVTYSAALLAKQERGITGKISLDSSWKRVVYLSLIPNFSERYTLSNKYVIDKARVDEDGNFSFGSTYFPKEDALFRMHITKKGDPAATLILGGPNENFCFLIANRNTPINITNNAQQPGIKDFKITGYGPNQSVAAIIRWAAVFDSVDFAPSTFKADLIADAYNEKMRQIADTSQHPLVALFALYQSDFEQNHNEIALYYNGFREKWKDEKSTYFAEFNSHFKSPAATERNYLLIYCMGCFVLGLAVAYVVFFYKKQQKHPLENLSVQEKKIYNLLKEGKSNKEISEEFSIGLSTVKSHVSSILSKMNVKSRKDLMEV